MNPGQIIDIQLVDHSGVPVRLGNVLPKVRLFYKGRTDGPPFYTFEVWPTDSDGRCQIRYDDLEDVRRLLGSADLMDFNTPLTECDPTVEIWIPPESDFVRRREIILKRVSWWRPAWLIEWPANGRLEPVEPKRIRLENHVTRVEIPVILRPNT